MHYFGAAVVPAGTTRDEVEKVLADVLAPHQEQYDEDTEEYAGVWDWYQVGGRWTGVWGEYDPHKDPRNVETCMVCGGSGTRAGGLERFGQEWFDWSHGCNGCMGEGTTVAWPTQWVDYDGDIIKVAALLRNPLRRPLTLFLPDGERRERETYHPNSEPHFVQLPDEEWEQVLADALEPYRDHALVVVDYHS